MAMTPEQIRTQAKAAFDYAVEARRHLHRHPELSFQEKESSAYIEAELRKLGYEPQTGIGGFGIKAVLQGAKPGPTIALRADIDALPITEETGLDFASENPGVMHACGHDAHTAILLGTAKTLKDRAADLAGTVVFIFQPGEEKDPGGASLMIADGVLENPTVDHIFGIHVFPLFPTGLIGLGAGPRLAAPDEIRITIKGKGGHGAYPHLCIDPIMTAAQCITLLQQIVARNVGPFQQGVITIGWIKGGSAGNVIPDEVTFGGTVRTMDPALRKLMPQRIEAVVRGVCEAAGATYDFHYGNGYPPLVNSVKETEEATKAALWAFGPEQVTEMPATMGGEDFAFYLEKVPGTFIRLGSTTPGIQSAPGLHTSKLMIDERCIETGIGYYLAVVERYLGGLLDA
ncbi:MAG TPA: amidohydrolase [Symbiobacteriaceae bacterium]|nr:amidohydrolase [Symbiobacteriaceae bacterium]